VLVFVPELWADAATIEPLSDALMHRHGALVFPGSKV